MHTRTCKNLKSICILEKVVFKIQEFCFKAFVNQVSFNAIRKVTL